MFSDEVTRARMQRSSEECAHDEIRDRIPPHRLDDNVVEAELDKDVEQVDMRERQLEDKHRSERVEQDLERAEKRLAQHAIQEHGLELCREVGIQPFNTE